MREGHHFANGLSSEWSVVFPLNNSLQNEIKYENSLDVPRTVNRTGDLAFSVAAPRLWSTFNQDLLNAKTLYNFKAQLRNYPIPKI